VFSDEPAKRTRFRKRKEPGMWSPQEILDHVEACYSEGDEKGGRLAVVVRMREDELPRRLVREKRAAFDGTSMEYDWWGIEWGGNEMVWALDDPCALCKIWDAKRSGAEARAAAAEWADTHREMSAIEIPRWPLIAILGAVRRGSGHVFG
jgi:hypothetical protein